MSSSTIFMIILGIGLSYGFYIQKKENRGRREYAQEVVDGLNARMNSIVKITDDRHKRYIERHIELDNKILANEKSIATVGEQLIALVRSVESSQLEVKDLLVKLNEGLNVHIKSMPKKDVKKTVKKKAEKAQRRGR